MPKHKKSKVEKKLPTEDGLGIPLPYAAFPGTLYYRKTYTLRDFYLHNLISSIIVFKLFSWHERAIIRICDWKLKCIQHKVELIIDYIKACVWRRETLGWQYGRRWLLRVRRRMVALNDLKRKYWAKWRYFTVYRVAMRNVILTSKMMPFVAGMLDKTYEKIITSLFLNDIGSKGSIQKLSDLMKATMLAFTDTNKIDSNRQYLQDVINHVYRKRIEDIMNEHRGGVPRVFREQMMNGADLWESLLLNVMSFGAVFAGTFSILATDTIFTSKLWDQIENNDKIEDRKKLHLYCSCICAYNKWDVEKIDDMSIFSQLIKYSEATMVDVRTVVCTKCRTYRSLKDYINEKCYLVCKKCRSGKKKNEVQPSDLLREMFFDTMKVKKPALTWRKIGPERIVSLAWYNIIKKRIEKHMP